MCNKRKAFNIDELLAGIDNDKLGMPNPKKGADVQEVSLAQLLELITKGPEGIFGGRPENRKEAPITPGITTTDEKIEVKTFGESVKLKNGESAKKISRKPFVLDRPAIVVNASGQKFPLVGFIRNKNIDLCFWIMVNGQWYADDYFYVLDKAPAKPVSPRVKMTLAEIEAKLGCKLEIEG